MISNNAGENMTKQYRYREQKTKQNNKKPLKDCEEKCKHYIIKKTNEDCAKWLVIIKVYYQE